MGLIRAQRLEEKRAARAKCGLVESTLNLLRPAIRVPLRGAQADSSRGNAKKPGVLPGRISTCATSTAVRRGRPYCVLRSHDFG